MFACTQARAAGGRPGGGEGGEGASGASLQSRKVEVRRAADQLLQHLRREEGERRPVAQREQPAPEGVKGGPDPGEQDVLHHQADVLLAALVGHRPVGTARQQLHSLWLAARCGRDGEGGHEGDLDVAVELEQLGQPARELGVDLFQRLERGGGLAEDLAEEQRRHLEIEDDA